MAGNVPAESHLMANCHPLANAWLNPLYPEAARAVELLQKTSYYPPAIYRHWACVSWTDILIPKSRLTPIQSDDIVTVLDTMYSEFKGHGLTKTKETMLSLSPDHADMLADVLSTVDEWSFVRSRRHRGFAYVPTSTCIHFMIIISHDKQARHTPCHQDDS